MNFNIYINDNLAKELDVIAINTHKKRNKLIQEAIIQLVDHYRKEKWPNSILKFQGINDVDKWEGFEQYRHELQEPKNIIFKE